MDFKDIFKHRSYEHHNNRGYYDRQHDVHHDRRGGLEQYLFLLKKLKSNKKLFWALSVAAIVIFIIAFAVITMLIPLMLKSLETIQTSWISGLDGINNAVRSLLELLLGWIGK